MKDCFGETPGAESFSTGAPLAAGAAAMGMGPEGSSSLSNCTWTVWKGREVAAKARMPARFGVGLQGNDAALKGGVLGHDEFAVGIDGVHQVRFNGLADLDRIVAADLDLQACSLGEDRLRGRDGCGLGRFGFAGGRRSRDWAPAKAARDEGCRDQKEETRWQRVGKYINKAPALGNSTVRRVSELIASWIAMLGGCGASFESGDFFAQGVEAREQFIVTLVGDGWVFGFDVERAIGLEFAEVNFVDVFEALAMDDFDEFLAGEGFVLQRLVIDLAVADQDNGAAFERTRRVWENERASGPRAN